MLYIINLEKLQVNKTYIILEDTSKITIQRTVKPLLYYTAGLVSGSLLSEAVRYIKDNSGRCNEIRGSLLEDSSSVEHSTQTQNEPNKQDKPSESIGINLQAQSEENKTMNNSRDQSRESTGQDKTNIEKNAVALYDIVSSEGHSIDVTDQSLDRALDLNKQVCEGRQICPSVMTKKQLDQRIKESELVPVTDDPRDLPRNICIDNDHASVNADVYEIGFEDEEDDGNDYQQQQDPITYDDPGEINDPIDWIKKSLQIIHADLQGFKPILSDIPIIKERIDDTQKVISEMGSTLNELSNSMKNMEKTITQNRCDIVKLTDLIVAMGGLSITSSAPPSVIRTEPSTPIPQSKTDTNITKFISHISKMKNLSADQEINLRNMLLIKDKEIILSTLKALGVTRSIMGAELDILLGLDSGSQKSMINACKIIMNLLPINPANIASCDISCPGSSSYTPMQVPKKIANPFKIKQAY